MGLVCVRVLLTVRVGLSHIWDWEVTIGIKADPRGYIGVCVLGTRTYGTWRV